MLAGTPLSRAETAKILRGFDLEIAENGFVRKIGENAPGPLLSDLVFVPPHSDLSVIQIADAWKLVDHLANYRLVMVAFSHFNFTVPTFERVVESVLGRSALKANATLLDDCPLRGDPFQFLVFSLIFSIIAYNGHASLLFAGVDDFKLLKLVDGLKILDTGPLVERSR